jgi:anti-sigma-K factor RskA
LTHEEAWTRLPDLLDDRDDDVLLAHVRVCADCQRQLFLLGRVDRLLQNRAALASMPDARGLRMRRRVTATAAAAAAAVLLGLLVFQPGRGHALMFRTASGQAVGHAVMSHSDARNVSLALVAEHLPLTRDRIFVLWAGDRARAPMLVGQFMVDRRGGCRVRFNLPADHDWSRFWITRPGHAAQIVAST